jgi:hypothetical protein
LVYHHTRFGSQGAIISGALIQFKALSIHIYYKNQIKEEGRRDGLRENAFLFFVLFIFFIFSGQFYSLF